MAEDSGAQEPQNIQAGEQGGSCTLPLSRKAKLISTKANFTASPELWISHTNLEHRTATAWKVARCNRVTTNSIELLDRFGG